jgi:hypothetical protein
MATGGDDPVRWWGVKVRCRRCKKVDTAGAFATAGPDALYDINTPEIVKLLIFLANAVATVAYGAVAAAANVVFGALAIPVVAANGCTHQGRGLGPRTLEAIPRAQRTPLPPAARPTASAIGLLRRLDITPVDQHTRELRQVGLDTADMVLTATQQQLADAGLPRMYVDAILHCEKRAPAQHAKADREARRDAAEADAAATDERESARYLRETTYALLKVAARIQAAANTKDAFATGVTALLARLDIQPVAKHVKALQKVGRFTDACPVEGVLLMSDVDLKAAGLSRPYREGFLRDAQVIAAREAASQSRAMWLEQWGQGFRHGEPDSPTHLPPGPVPLAPMGDWVPYEDAPGNTCMVPACTTTFGVMDWHHHCEICGSVVCGSCSGQLGVAPAKTRRCWRCQDLIDAPRWSQADVDAMAADQAAAARLGPLVAQTLGGDRYELAEWGTARDLKRALSQQNPALGPPSSFTLVAAGGETTAPVEPFYRSADRARMLSGARAPEVAVVFAPAPAPRTAAAEGGGGGGDGGNAPL